jgi:nucleotide-binding universal stress UspA family protein
MSACELQTRDPFNREKRVDRRMRIVIGYDGSASSTDALVDLRRAGLPLDAEAMLITVADVGLPCRLVSEYEPLAASPVEPAAAHAAYMDAQTAVSVREALKIALAGSERLQAIFPAWNVRAQSAVGSPAWELIRKAGEWRADLIVLGPQGHCALKWLVLGSVAQQVVSQASCGVRIGRCDDQAKALPAMLVIGMDGSPHSDADGSEVAKRRWPSGTKAKVVMVLDPVTLTADGSDRSPRETRQEELTSAQKLVGGAAGELRSAGIDAAATLVAGDPRQVLINQASQYGAHCIFVGARGAGRSEDSKLGSVASWVAARALFG